MPRIFRDIAEVVCDDIGQYWSCQIKTEDDTFTRNYTYVESETGYSSVSSKNQDTPDLRISIGKGLDGYCHDSADARQLKCETGEVTI